MRPEVEIRDRKKVKNVEPVILKRSEAYIGVLIDDLIHKGTDEPYRMFTSRAEYRTLLRQDNADFRLTPLSYNLGLASKERMDNMLNKQKQVNHIVEVLNTFSIEPEEINPYLEKVGSAIVAQKQKAAQLLLRPNICLMDMIQSIPRLTPILNTNSIEAIEQAEIQTKYHTYIEKERELVARMSQLEDLLIPTNFDYGKLNALSAEARQKFNNIKPRTLGQASRISGVNPSDIQILMVYMGR